jgi:NPCBM-associated, NEW3 domain of alpha-galactosidase
MYKKTIQILLLLFLIQFSLSTLLAQTGSYYNQRDDQYRVLGLKRAREAYETARKEYERQQELHNRNLITSVALDNARNIYTDAEVNYQQSLLAVLFEKQYVSVEKAVKYHAKDGSRHVKLTLVNASGGSAEFQKLINMEDELFRSLQPDIVNNVYVSILNNDQAIISQPYERKIPELKFGQPQVLDFQLLEDLDAVTIFIIYSNGSQRSMKIFLQKDATVNKVEVQSEQFSQEVELGKSASFDLTLELFSGINNTFNLEVVNLPRQINRYFNDARGQVRLRHVKFTESSRTKRASLEIKLPDRPTDEVLIDQPIEFYALVLPRDRKDELPDLQSKIWTRNELEALDIGFVRLELLPRGKGKLLVRSPQLFHSINPDESAEMYIDLINEGSNRLDNIEVKVDLPLNWDKNIAPTIIPSLEIGEEARINLIFTPPDDVSVGKYNLRIRTSGMSSGQPVRGEEKSVTVAIEAQANIFGTVVIVLLIVGLVGAVVIFGIRLSKR